MKKMNLKKGSKFFSIGVGFLAVGALIFYAGYTVGHKNSIVITDSHQILNADFSLFWDAANLVKSKYVNAKDVKDQDLLYGAVQGMVGALGDPYSVFFSPSDAKRFEQDLAGSFGGIGAEIGVKDSQLVIVAPLKGNPAEEVGLRAGDKILKIDDAVTSSFTTDQAVKLIRGEPGTTVRLLILREGWKEAKEFKITRKIVVVPTLDWEIKPGDILYLHLYNFNGNATQLFYSAVFNGLMQQPKGVVLDLRNDPGGFLDVATQLAGWFLKRGDVVVREKFHSGDQQVFYAQGNGSLANLPVVVLVNGGSASASEILAGALRDMRGAKLIGDKTFGKGSVQEMEDMKDGSSLKITIAAWLTPNGDEIDKKGLTPDIEVKLTDDDVKNGKDPQLEKALEVIKSQ